MRAFVVMTIVSTVACASPAQEEPPARASAETPPSVEASPPEGPVAAVVNGRAITEDEVNVRRRGRGRRRIPRAEALEAIIEEELQAQAAEKSGLHETEAVQKELALARAAFKDARRQLLAKGYRLQALEELPEASPAEVDAYIQRHANRIRTTVRIERVTTKTRAAAEQARAALVEGKSAAEIAAALPQESGPVGPVGFQLLPDKWWQVIEKLQPGRVSEVIASTAERFVVLRLVERKTVDMPPRDVLERTVRARLKADSLDGVRARREAELRKNAKIEIPGA